MKVVPSDHPAAVEQAAAALREGQVVAVPTDTVYGIAALPDDGTALEAVFELKGRPQEVALPVLIGQRAQLGSVVRAWPPAAEALTAAYWPGPLTVVAPASASLVGRLGGDGDSVGVRWPRHRFVEALCRETGPLAVTSANRHGVPPRTTAQEVTEHLAELTLVVDGGRCEGRPSTVVDCRAEPARCLREGALEWVSLAGLLDTRPAG